MKKLLLLIPVIFFASRQLQAQTKPAATDTVIRSSSVTIEADSAVTEIDSRYTDSLRKRRIRRTILHSTFVPGWGQINNRQIWKTPMVAAAISIPVLLFFDNLKQYKELRQAYIYRTDKIDSNNSLIPEKFAPLSANSLKYYRDAYRQNVDYSALAFIIAWGLNVVDAAVYAHLRDFDVSDKLSMHITPRMDGMKRGNLALVFTFKDANKTARPFNF